MALISCSYVRGYLVAHVQGSDADHATPEHIGERGGLGHRHSLLLLGRLHVHSVHDVVGDRHLIKLSLCIFKENVYSLIMHLVGSGRLLDNLLGLRPLSICQKPPDRFRHDEEQSRKS